MGYLIYWVGIDNIFIYLTLFNKYIRGKMLFDMRRLKTIEKDFVLKPNPYVTEEKSNSIIWKLAVGELSAVSAVLCLSLTFFKIKPSITLANSFRNFTYFQGLSSIGILYYHLYELN